MYRVNNGEGVDDQITFEDTNSNTGQDRSMKTTDLNQTLQDGDEKSSVESQELESNESTESFIRRDTNRNRTFKANPQFIKWMFNMMWVQSFQLGHVVACINQVQSTFAAKFQVFQENPTLYRTLLGSSGIFGTTIGAILGGSIVKIGRRNTFIAASTIAFLGSFISMFEILPVILIGRMIYGFGCGLLSICAPRFIEETVPDNLVPLYQPFFLSSLAVGTLFSLLMGAGLPNDNQNCNDSINSNRIKYFMNDPVALRESGFWRFIIGFPMLLQITSITLMLCYIKYDSIRFLISNAKFNDAREIIALCS